MAIDRKLFPLLLLLLLGGCAVPSADSYAEEELPLPPVDTTLQRPAGPPPARADSLVDHLRIEGAQEPMTFHLFRAPEGFPLGFSTYVPGDVDADVLSSGEGDAVRFTARFGGVPNEAALLSVHFPTEERSADDAQRRVREIAASHGAPERVSDGAFSWALEEYRFQTRDRVGRVALGRHAGRYFEVIVAYPPEMGDGFAPRAHRILGEWRWEDGSRMGS